MIRSNQATNHLFIKASSTSSCDQVDFAIVNLSVPWIKTMFHRLIAIQAFSIDQSFHSHTYWNPPSGYYLNPKCNLLTEQILLPGENWAFVKLQPGDEKSFIKPANPLEAHQLCINANRYANFKAFSQHTHETYLTECFSVVELLAAYTAKPLDSS
uniref:hypothetical protein n=1 Tax=Pedobacter schmidteae TaxID=2201271 RepID=UPI0013CF2F9C|nr:hypothetical protein [Pedobacter schmidteae]